MVIGTEYIDSYEYNHHTITNMMAVTIIRTPILHIFNQVVHIKKRIAWILSRIMTDNGQNVKKRTYMLHDVVYAN